MSHPTLRQEEFKLTLKQLKCIYLHFNREKQPYSCKRSPNFLPLYPK